MEFAHCGGLAPTLGLREELDLARRIRGAGRDGPAAEEELIRRNLALARHAARALGRRLDPADAFGIAQLALVKAAKGYRPEWAVRFAAYFLRVARTEFLDWASRNGHAIPIPGHAFRRLVGIRGGRGVPAPTRALRRNLDAILAVQRVVRLGDGMDDLPGETPPAGDADSGLAEALDGAIGRLDDRERLVIRARFGIGGDRMTLPQLGALLGVSRDSVRGIQERALSKLRADPALAC